MKAGDILIAIDACEMDYKDENGNSVFALTVGKEYEIIDIYNKDVFAIIDDQKDNHLFDGKKINEFFKLKEEKQMRKYHFLAILSSGCYVQGVIDAIDCGNFYLQFRDIYGEYRSISIVDVSL